MYQSDKFSLYWRTIIYVFLILMLTFNETSPYFLRRNNHRSLLSLHELGTITRRQEVNITNYDTEKFQTISRHRLKHFGANSKSRSTRQAKVLLFEYPDYQTTVDEDISNGSIIISATLKNYEKPSQLKITHQHLDYILLEVTNKNFSAQIAPDKPVINIITVATLDFDDNGGYYTFYVRATNKTTDEIAVATIRVFTKNKNDEAPRFTQDIYTGNVDETAKQSALVATVVATDKDGDKISYKFDSGEEHYKMFRFHEQGVIRLHGENIQFDQDKYELKVIAIDDGSCCKEEKENIHTSTATVVVNIIDVNDNKPIFLQCSLYNASIKENKLRGSHVITMKATDKDRGLNGEVEYYIMEQLGQSKNFQIDRITGNVTTYKIFDREAEKMVPLTVKATDKGKPPLEGLCTIQVKIIDENDNSPQFVRKKYDERIPSNKRKDDFLFRVSATDMDIGDNAKIRYSFSPEQEYFSIDEESGNVKLKEILKEGERFHFKAIATDTGNPPLSSEVDVDIETLELDIQPPQWEKDEYVVQFPENVLVNVEIVTVKATSKDEKIIYTILEGETNEKQKFFLQQNTENNQDVGKIQLNSALDYEDTKTHNITVTAQLSGDIPLSSDTVVVVHVTDVNDEIPLFQNVEQASVLENKAVNTEVVTITAYDRDETKDFSKVFYNITEGFEFFSIDEEDGIVRTKVSFDREMKSTYRIKVEARDGAPSARPNVPLGEPNRHFQTFRITIGDENDNSPIFAETSYNFTVKENEDIGHKIALITATDEDEFSQIEYHLPSGNEGGAFGVNSKTGEIYVAGSIDYETRKRYELILVAKDGRFQNSTTVEITVEDMNDLPPKFAMTTYAVNLTEEDPNVPKVFLTVFATDGDKDREQDIKYFLTGPGTEESDHFFKIDVKSGDISILKSLDRDLPHGRPQWRFTVGASDEGGGKGSLFGYAEVIIVLHDINDNDPLFKSDIHFGYVTENFPKNELALSVEAKDYDDNEVLSYEITNNVYDEEGKEIFYIISENGAIRTAICCLDRETIPEYIIGVKVTDKGGRYATANATIIVKDENDNPPKFNQKHYYVDTDETGDNLPTQPILVVTVNDKDLPGTNNNYFTIVENSGSGWDRFSLVRLDADKGQLTVRMKLDYEDPVQREGFSFQIRVNDVEGLTEDINHTAIAYVTITIRDINDNPPEFENPNIMVNISETTPRGTAIATFKATDKDNEGNSQVRYEIDRVSNRRRHFNISSEGNVTILRELDREEKPEYQVIILAVDDGKPPKTATATLIVNVIDVNDNPPAFCEDYRGFVKENSLGPFPEKVLNEKGDVLILKACDPDDPVAGNGPPFTFSLDSNAPEVIKKIFSVENQKDAEDERSDSAFLLVRNKLDREEQKEYKIPITITDSGKPQKFGTSTLTVVIQDENDNPMKDGTTDILVYTFKGKFPKMIIGRVYVDDLDDDDWNDKSYSYEQINENFLVNVRTGEITMLNGTKEGIYNFEVLVQDNVLEQSAKSIVTIRVENIPLEAVYKSASIRITGLTEEEFVSVWDYKNKKLKGSKRVLLSKKIAEIIGVKDENVQVFTALKSRHPQRLDVRFAVHGSPYYEPEKVNGLLSENLQEIGISLGIDIEMMGIDECLYENVNCEGSCTNELIFSEKPYAIISPRTAFVGINSSVLPKCICKAREDFSHESCKPNPCYNGGRCEIQINGLRKCTCSEGFDGPLCQKTTCSFFGNGYAWFPPLQQCENSHLSLEFITSEDDGLLFYNGPISEPISDSNKVQDFISLELVGGKPRLLLDFGSGTLQLTVEESIMLSDGEWHRIDVYWQPEIITLTVDLCKHAILHDGNEGNNNLDKCKADGRPILLNEYLNVNGPLQLGGVRHPALKNYNWEHQHGRKGFNGCIKNFIHNSEMYDLQTTSLGSDMQPGCPHTEQNCLQPENKTYCVNGVCLSSIAPNKFHCLCNPGFHGKKCEFETTPSMFHEKSFVQYELLNNYAVSPQFISKIQISFRAYYPDGGLMFLQGVEKTFMKLEIAHSVLWFHYNLNREHFQNRSLSISHFNASDGFWHTVNVARYGTSVMVSVDNSGGKYYNESIDYNISDQFFQVLSKGVVLGGYFNTSMKEEINDLYKACLNDIRFPTEFHHLPMPPAELKMEHALVEKYDKLTIGCNTSSCVGVICPELMECVDIFFHKKCRCITGYVMNMATQECVDRDECDEYPSPCFNGGICHNEEGSFWCECPDPYSGDFCGFTKTDISIIEERQLRLSMTAMAAMLVCLIVIILVFIFLIYKVTRRPKYLPVDSRDDIRDNIANYNDEGGGEYDAETFDLKHLQVPDNPKSEVDGFNNFLNKSMEKANDDPGTHPLDDVRVYAFEGTGSDAGSLSSLSSGDDDYETDDTEGYKEQYDSDNSDQDFRYLRKLGPRFRNLASIYTTDETDL